MAEENVKDNLEKILSEKLDKRELLACLILAGICSGPERRRTVTYAENNVRFAIWYADKVIKELETPSKWEPDPDFLSDYL